MEEALAELRSLLRGSNVKVRRQAAEAVLGLTGSNEGSTLLVKHGVIPVLVKSVSDNEEVASIVVRSMINLSSSSDAMEQLMTSGLVSSLMESLRDADCKHKREIVMLLTNLSQTDEGCIQLMQLKDASAGVKGLHLRRLIQWFVAPVKVPAGRRWLPDLEADFDTFEYAGDILANATRLDEARQMLLEPERRILPVLFPQLQSPSLVRRRGVASTLRNCCFEKDERVLKFMFSTSVDIVTALLLPLAGPDRYKAADKEGMNPALYKHASGKEREGDPAVRRHLVEAILLLCATQLGREHLRAAKAYPVLKTFHEWLEGYETTAATDGAAAAEGDSAAAAAAAPAAAPAADSSSPDGVMVGSRKEGEGDDDSESHLCPDDEATVEAINQIVQHLFRTDEVPWPEPPAAAAPSAAANTAKPGDETAVERLAGMKDREQYKAGVKAAATSGGAGGKRKLYEERTPEEARARAEAIANNRDLDDDDVEKLITEVPDWREADPVLPPAFQYPSYKPPPGSAGAAAAAAPASSSGAVTAEAAAPAAVAAPANSTASAVEAAGMGGVD